MNSQKEEILKYAWKEKNIKSEHLWKNAPENEVLRHKENRKWYAVFMVVKKEVLGLPGEGYVDIIDLKLEPFMVSILREKKGYHTAYHMNKKSWITIRLDGSVSLEEILNLLEESYAVTMGKKERKKTSAGQRDWLIPANPKYYDVVKAFEESEVIDWKQSSDVQAGDMVYMYVAAPYSAVLYRCKAVEVDIPYRKRNELNINRLMKIQLLDKYEPDFMPLTRLKEEFDVFAVRGPRGVPNSLKYELDMYCR